MDEPREIFNDGRHALRGPHYALPAGFVPLRLRVLPAGTAVVVTCLQALVGRHTAAAVRLADPEVSRSHCWLHFHHGQWRLTDLGSTNGVFVNGERRAEVVLYDGDVVRLGGVTLAIDGATPVLVHQAENSVHDVIRRIAESLPPEA